MARKREPQRVVVAGRIDQLNVFNSGPKRLFALVAIGVILVVIALIWREQRGRAAEHHQLIEGQSQLAEGQRQLPGLITRMVNEKSLDGNDMGGRTAEEQGIIHRGLADPDAPTRARAAVLAGDPRTDELVIEATAVLGDFDRLVLQGDQHFYADRPDEAVTPYAAAVKIRPTDPTALNNLAVALFSQRRSQDWGADARTSAELLRRACKSNRDPIDDLDAALRLHNLAVVLMALGRTAEAEGTCREALRRSQERCHGDDPGIANTLNTLACLLIDSDHAIDAAQVAGQSLAMRLRLFKGADTAVVAHSLTTLANALSSSGQLCDAEPLYRQAIEIYERLGTCDENVTSCIESFAELLKTLGCLAEADSTSLAAMTMCHRLYSGDHPAVAYSLDARAGVLSALERHLEALPLFRRALEMRQRLFRGDHPAIAMSLANVGACEYETGDAAEAEGNLWRAVNMCLRLPDSNADVTQGLGSLASVLLDTGRETAARAVASEATRISQFTLPERLLSAASSLTGLARVLISQDDTSGAEPLCRDALAIYRGAFWGDHAEVAGALNLIGLVLYRMHRLEEAEAVCRAALDMRQRLHAGDHPSIANDLNSLGLVVYSIGERDEGERLCRRAVEMAQRLYPGGHLDTVHYLQNLAQMLSDAHPSEAESADLAALEILRRLNPGDDPSVAAALDQRAAVLRHQGRLIEADLAVRESLGMRERLFRGDHLDVASSLNSLACTLSALGYATEAEEVSKRSLEMNVRLRGTAHPALVGPLTNLAVLCYENNRFDEAETLIDEAMELVLRYYGPHHPDTQYVSSWWARICSQSGLLLAYPDRGG